MLMRVFKSILLQSDAKQKTVEAAEDSRAADFRDLIHFERDLRLARVSSC